MKEIVKLDPNGVCPKCGMPQNQMLRFFCIGGHSLVIDKEVKTCNIKGEHLHLECCCSHELIVRPLDWNVKKGNK